MELIIWRHAEAEEQAPGQDDAERALTAKGHKQARKVAAWLDRKLPSQCRILASPAKRTRQTADALDRKYKTSDELATMTTAERILAAVNWPDSKEPVLIVGHQPTLGHLVSLLLTGVEQDWTIRKGAVVWIARKDDDETAGNYLKAAIGPDLAGQG